MNKQRLLLFSVCIIVLLVAIGVGSSISSVKEITEEENIMDIDISGFFFLNKEENGYSMGYRIDLDEKCIGSYVSNYHTLLAAARKIAGSAENSASLDTENRNDFDYSKADYIWEISNNSENATVSAFSSSCISIIPSQTDCYEDLVALISEYKGEIQIETLDGRIYKGTFVFAD